MLKENYFIYGKHAVIAALKNTDRNIEKIYIDKTNYGLQKKIKILLNETNRVNDFKLVNNNFIDKLSSKGLMIVGKSKDKMLVEVIELKDHPWFVGCQFHPEFTSDPRRGHPLFSGFIKAAKNRSNLKK